MEIEVFECNSGVGKESGRPFNIVLARVDGKVGKIFSDVPVPTGKVEVSIEMSSNREMFLTPRIVKVG